MEFFGLPGIKNLNQLQSISKTNITQAVNDNYYNFIKKKNFFHNSVGKELSLSIWSAIGAISFCANLLML